MTNQPPVRSNRSYTTLAAAIVVAAVIIAATLFTTLGTSTTVTKTSTQTTTVITTLLVSSSKIATDTSTNNTGARLYGVTFQQTRYCGQFNIMPWAVTLNALTEVQPSNQSLPLPTNTFSTIVPNQNLTRITFSVPPGAYNYTIEGGAGFNGFYPTSGAVQVNGSDVLVNVGVYLSFTCTSTTTT